MIKSYIHIFGMGSALARREERKGSAQEGNALPSQFKVGKREYGSLGRVCNCPDSAAQRKHNTKYQIQNFQPRRPLKHAIELIAFIGKLTLPLPLSGPHFWSPNLP